MASKKKKGNPKYCVQNEATKEFIFTGETKKYALEWLNEQVDSLLDDHAHLEFSKSLYGKGFDELVVTPAAIKNMNRIRVNEAFKKVLKKKMNVNGEILILKIEETED